MPGEVLVPRPGSRRTQARRQRTADGGEAGQSARIPPPRPTASVPLGRGPLSSSASTSKSRGEPPHGRPRTPRRVPAGQRRSGPPAPGRTRRKEADRNTAPDGLGPVALLRQPGDVSLDLGRDPGPSKPIDRRRLEEVQLQHGTTSVQRMNRRTNDPRSRARYVAIQCVMMAPTLEFGGVGHITRSAKNPDNMPPVVADADPVNPKLTVGWLDYAQHCGFVTDTARVASPKDKPRVERTVQYVRGSLWAGEEFTDLTDAQARTRVWCADVAGQRIHGTIAARPAQVFAEHEAGALLGVPAAYDVPVFKTCKVHRDFHLEIGRALYSVPKVYIGQYLDVRAD